MTAWLRLTSFGDSIVTIPAAAAIVLWLLSGRAWRMALWWTVLFGAGMALVVATKIAFIGWGIGIAAIDFTGFSGHAMRATAVLPVIGFLAFNGGRQRVRVAGFAVGLAIALLISVSRVMVDAHSVSEAVSGALLGSAISLIFIRITSTIARPVVNGWLVVLSLAGLFWVSTAEPAPTQELLTDIALELSGHDRAFTRADWIAQSGTR
ncbi:MAG: phosphatase PAP2 family protein [Oxalobacteraceae bacterium]|nr:phosphatase PAP2 family protein [Oxalobacteraceae bacterium]